MQTRQNISRPEVLRAGAEDDPRAALVEALKRLWNAVKERIFGETPVPVPVPVRVHRRR